MDEEQYVLVAAEQKILRCWMPCWAVGTGSASEGRRQIYVALAGRHDVSGCWHEVFRWDAGLVAVFGIPKRR